VTPRSGPCQWPAKATTQPSRSGTGEPPVSSSNVPMKPVRKEVNKMYQPPLLARTGP
jgi:hypothetical protein